MRGPYKPHACGIWNIAHLCDLLSGAGLLVSHISELCSISHMHVACNALASYLYTTYTPLIFTYNKNYICHNCYKSLPSDRNIQVSNNYWCSICCSLVCVAVAGFCAAASCSLALACRVDVAVGLLGRCSVWLSSCPVSGRPGVRPSLVWGGCRTRALLCASCGFAGFRPRPQSTRNSRILVILQASGID